jgi:hypothetical protein
LTQCSFENGLAYSITYGIENFVLQSGEEGSNFLLLDHFEVWGGLFIFCSSTIWRLLKNERQAKKWMQEAVMLVKSVKSDDVQTGRTM